MPPFDDTRSCMQGIDVVVIAAKIHHTIYDCWAGPYIRPGGILPPEPSGGSVYGIEVVIGAAKIYYAIGNCRTGFNTCRCLKLPLNSTCEGIKSIHTAINTSSIDNPIVDCGRGKRK